MKIKRSILLIVIVFTLVGGLAATEFGFGGFKWIDNPSPAQGAPWSQPPNGWAQADNPGWNGFKWIDNPSPAQGAPWSQPPNGWAQADNPGPTNYPYPGAPWSWSKPGKC